MVVSGLVCGCGFGRGIRRGGFELAGGVAAVVDELELEDGDFGVDGGGFEFFVAE